MKPCSPMLTALALGILLLVAPYARNANSPAFASAERKFAWIGENGKTPTPSTRPTVVTAEEWNAYLNQGGVKLPDGLSNIRISSQPGVAGSGAAHGDAEVDFDRLTANRTRSNPLLALFTGKHLVTVIAQASGTGGVGRVHVESVMFDGLTVPRIALEYFADRYLRPKYGNAVGMDSTFRLPSRIDTATLGSDQLTLIQR
jgi:hypothetical protein